MDRKHEILQLRERLDKVLAFPDLLNEESIRTLVKNQYLDSSLSSFKGDAEKIIEKRTKEVSTFLEMLRSASENEMKAKSHDAGYIDWKIKQDTDELRVMYREGPQGTPFHTLLAEGYADGPLDVCLCVSWETSLYKKWFPQYKVPTFKVILSTCLQKIQVGEEISLVRVKVPWPISDREALLHYFEIEYLQEDLILVLMKTISSSDRLDESIDDFSGYNIPEAKDATRIDLVGGLVVQKIDENRSYFRTIATMDIKLDFVPPWLINFMSRQLIGTGHKLFQKVLSTVAIHDEDYLKALEGPMYARIHEGLAAKNKIQSTEDRSDNKKPTLLSEEHISDNAAEFMSIGDNADYNEIVEEETEHSSNDNSDKLDDDHLYHQDLIAKEVNISPGVVHALRIADRAIAVLRTQRISENQINYSLPASQQTLQASPIVNADACGPGNSACMLPRISQADQLHKTSRHTLSSSASLSEKKIANVDSENVTVRDSSQGKLLQSSATGTRPSFLETMNKVCDEGSLEANDNHKRRTYRHNAHNNWKTWLCCFTPTIAKG